MATKRRVSEQRLRKLYRELGGNITKIAKRIGYTRAGTYRAYDRLRSWQSRRRSGRLLGAPTLPQSLRAFDRLPVGPKSLKAGRALMRAVRVAGGR